MTTTKLLRPSYGESKFRCRSRRDVFWGATSGPKSGKGFSFKKWHEARQIDQQNVLNAKVYVVAVKNDLFPQGSEVRPLVRIGQNWSAECHDFIIVTCAAVPTPMCCVQATALSKVQWASGSC